MPSLVLISNILLHVEEGLQNQKKNSEQHMVFSTDILLFPSIPRNFQHQFHFHFTSFFLQSFLLSSFHVGLGFPLPLLAELFATHTLFATISSILLLCDQIHQTLYDCGRPNLMGQVYFPLLLQIFHSFLSPAIFNSLFYFTSRF